MTPSEILIAAKALIPTEREWGQARRPGHVVMSGKMCAGMAIEVAGKQQQWSLPAKNYLRHAVGIPSPFGDYTLWNDAPGRTLTEVHAAFDLASDMALVNGE